jgi:DNA-binding NarL/FixJ family response regulator
VGAELALQASEGFAAAERSIDAARARALAGQALGKIDDHDGATRLLQRARAELDACGARGYRDEASRELRRLGERAPRLDRRGARQNVGPEVLSAREREVADLVARGMTNRQIAEELFVSPKTIESHLSHIFEKAGVPSRAAVAATVERWRRESAG